MITAAISTSRAAGPSMNPGPSSTWTWLIAQQMGSGSNQGARWTTILLTSFHRCIWRSSFSKSLRMVQETQPWHNSSTDSRVTSSRVTLR